VDHKDTIERGWYYVKEPDDGLHAEGIARVLRDPAGRPLTRRAHGTSGRIQVVDHSETGLCPATLLRAAAAVNSNLETHRDGHVIIHLGPDGTALEVDDLGILNMDGPWLAGLPSHHLAAKKVAELAVVQPRADTPPLNGPPAVRILCFESLMNSDMPHNDKELSQGVLHMVSPLKDLPTEVVFANVKMSIAGEDRTAHGLERLEQALEQGPFDLVCITLLEGYFDGCVSLIEALRARGCRAHIAVGGVMPTLAPEHVAAHMPDVSFVCRGDGECFVRPLVEIIGQASVDTPFSEGQIYALSNLDGLIARVTGPEGPTLVSGRSDLTAKVEELDQVALDLAHLLPRHIEGGIEVSTARGCIHKCTFCSILGREQYRARSADGVFELFDRYSDHFAKLFGDRVPNNAYRVHICDDDFACDRNRAATFFKALPATPFRLSSVQVSIADLCKNVDGVLQAEPDHSLLDAITPDCFADASRPIPTRDFVLDHKSRNWSSYLQIGVETFSEAELIRLGKGYRVQHIRTIVDALARRGLHMDGYFIQSNSETTAADLINGLDELCRIKMAYPVHFHIRFPIVPHLVSYFTSASHRRIVRQGREDIQKRFRIASVPSHPEYDYPFVDHDIPQDPWVRVAVDQGFFTDEDRYSGSFEKLRTTWIDRLKTLDDSNEVAVGERLIRQLDDRSRRRAFELLERAREVEHNPSTWRPGIPDSAAAMNNATAVLGPSQRWLTPFKRYVSQSAPRLVVIPTWQCELRCRYCFIPKQDGRVMTHRTLERSIDMLLASDRDQVILQFFGGEALIEWDLVQHAIRYGTEHAQKWGKRIRYIISSNGWSIDEDKLTWLRDFDVKLELSLDGDAETQNSFRRALKKGRDSYGEGIPEKAEMIQASGLDHEVIMVVHPEAVDRMPANFFHIVGLGYPRVQINFALGFIWTPEQKQAFAKGLHQIGAELKTRWAQGHDVTLVNLEGAPMPIRLNGEITVDWDGTVYGGNAFLHETKHKQNFVIGHLDDLGSFDRYWMDSPSNEYLLDWSYPPDVTKNNLDVGRIFTSFHRWMHLQTAEQKRAPTGALDRPS
jgi:MoaA/NifB/PqqE/SkfB family radical SAM enzyme